MDADGGGDGRCGADARGRPEGEPAAEADAAQPQRLPPGARRGAERDEEAERAEPEPGRTRVADPGERPADARAEQLRRRGDGDDEQRREERDDRRALAEQALQVYEQ